MFTNNKYTNIYYLIIERYSSVNGEEHHIIPKSLGGSNEKSNLVIVPPRVHFILHKLLCRMVSSEKHKKSMYYALFQMMNRKICSFTSRDYEVARNFVKETMRQNNPMHNPAVSSKFSKKRPEQSIVAKRRNELYWKNNGRPIRNFDCPICTTSITTRIPTKTTCSKSCAGKLQHMKEPVI